MGLAERVWETGKTARQERQGHRKDGETRSREDGEDETGDMGRRERLGDGEDGETGQERWGGGRTEKRDVRRRGGRDGETKDWEIGETGVIRKSRGMRRRDQFRKDQRSHFPVRSERVIMMFSVSSKCYLRRVGMVGMIESSSRVGTNQY